MLPPSGVFKVPREVLFLPCGRRPEDGARAPPSTAEKRREASFCRQCLTSKRFGTGLGLASRTSFTVLDGRCAKVKSQLQKMASSVLTWEQIAREDRLSKVQ